jgi:hypothetical protein
MEDLYNKDWKDRIEDIKNNLYIGGGKGQASALMSILMSPYAQKDFGYSDIDVSDVLMSIAHQIKELRSTIRNGGIVPIKIFENSFKNVIQNHMAYACLDNNLKFCVKHYGDDDWKDILYVFPYMNCMTAFDVSFKYDHIHQTDF